MSGDRLALVTGGCRRLGAVIAAVLAREGWALALHASHEGPLELGLGDVLAETGAVWAAFHADFVEPGAPEGLMADVVARFGRAPALLVNNASMFGDDVLATLTGASLRDHFAVNCAAPALLIKAFAAAGGDGDRSVVNILDQRIVQPNGDQFAYTLSKQALAGLTQMAARVLAPAIRVNAVAPGLTLPTADYTSARMARLTTQMPLARLPQPEQIADAIIYLTRATATTGQTIYVDGGAHLESFSRDFINLD